LRCEDDRAVMPHNPTPCHLCGLAAVAVFYFSRGCYCNPSTVQSLCEHHARKSGPAAGGTMELIKDLTEGSAFSGAWSH
jgi:hypothetical protein